MHQLDLQIDAGEYVAVMGPSGSGKSTLLNLLGLLDRPNAGTYRLEGRDVTTLSAEEQARVRSERIGFVFQSFHLVPRLTAAENIALPMVLSGIAPTERRKRVDQALKDYGLTNRSGHRPNELSGGQRQRVAIARALILNPQLIVCDEPTSALDVSVQSQILNLLMDLRRDFKLTYLFISHNLAVVEHIADRVGVMYLGRIAEMAPAPDLFAAPRHPYSQALLNSVLTPEPGAGVPDIGLRGTFPDPLNPPAGCVFHPRCPREFGPCSSRVPALLPADSGQGSGQVACHLANPEFSSPTEPLHVA